MKIEYVLSREFQSNYECNLIEYSGKDSGIWISGCSDFKDFFFFSGQEHDFAHLQLDDKMKIEYRVQSLKINHFWQYRT